MDTTQIMPVDTTINRYSDTRLGFGFGFEEDLGTFFRWRKGWVKW